MVFLRVWTCLVVLGLICIATPVLSFHANPTIPGTTSNTVSKIFDLTSTWQNGVLSGTRFARKASTTILGVSSSASLGASDAVSATSQKELVGKAVFLLPHNANEIKSKFGSYSPYGSPSILEAAEQLQRKTLWFSDGAVEADIILMPDADDDFSAIRQQILDANALVVFNMERESDLSFVNDLFSERKSTSGEKDLCQFALDFKGTKSNPSSLCGPYDAESPSLSSLLLPWSNDASGKRMEEQMMGLFDRWTSDDFTYAIMVFFNQYAAPIDWVKHSIDATWEKGPVRNAQEFYKMISKCGDCIAKCVADENCKECLDALTAVDTSDQVASYRTLVSYESDLLRDFSYCILQKNNIFGCDAKIPQLPQVTPMSTFRGKPLTKEVARKILIGHLNDEDALDNSLQTEISWKVSAGANVAYDQFPSQNQIFYNSADGRSMWYDPVFRVETIDGRNVWAKRHYRVRDGKVPGTFRFSVLDNGVTSDEFWTLVDVADDLSYIIFHYAGAAGAVGQRYLGGLLCTAEGSLPSETERKEKIYPKLRAAGIDPWELFIVDNREDSAGMIDAGPPPLDFFRKDVLKRKEELRQAH
mmetsp:Transcript_24665/g.68095  ORF Transcript_24665/g.68095 Transcript_24665/m.68095 type:complete len:588 (+) Transcript_24665:165-1928(+)